MFGDARAVSSANSRVHCGSGISCGSTRSGSSPSWFQTDSSTTSPSSDRGASVVGSEWFPSSSSQRSSLSNGSISHAIREELSEMRPVLHSVMSALSQGDLTGAQHALSTLQGFLKNDQLTALFNESNVHADSFDNDTELCEFSEFARNLQRQSNSHKIYDMLSNSVRVCNVIAEISTAIQQEKGSLTPAQLQQEIEDMLQGVSEIIGDNTHIKKLVYPFLKKSITGLNPSFANLARLATDF